LSKIFGGVVMSSMHFQFVSFFFSAQPYPTNFGATIFLSQPPPWWISYLFGSCSISHMQIHSTDLSLWNLCENLLLVIWVHDFSSCVRCIVLLWVSSWMACLTKREC